MLQRPVSARVAYLLRLRLILAQPLQPRVQVAEILCHWHVMHPGLQLRLEKFDVGVSHIEQGGAAEQQIPAGTQFEKRETRVNA